MRVIELDGSSWRDADDFYDALLPALGAPAWHGRNFNALLDSIVTGSINDIEPPYLLRIAGVGKWPTDLRAIVRDLRACIGERAREKGREVEIVLVGDF